MIKYKYQIYLKLGLAISSVKTLLLSKDRGWNWSECIKRMCYKELWNILTWPSSVVRNGCEGTIWPSSASRIGFRGVQTSNPWTINCGLFWRTWHVKTITTAWRAWGYPLWMQRQRFPWRRSARRQQSGRRVSWLASRHKAAILSDIIITENLKLLQINYLVRKVAVVFNSPSRSHHTCKRTYGKT